MRSVSSTLTHSALRALVLSWNALLNLQKRLNFLALHFKERIDLTLLDDQRWSVLHHLIDSSIVDSIQVVLNLAQETGQLDQILDQRVPYSGDSPLHMACDMSGWLMFGNKAVVEHLIDAGSDVNAVNNFYYTPLMLAIKAIGTPNSNMVIDLLVEKGANLTMRNRVGKTAADIAYGKGRDDIGRYLSCRMSIIKPLDHEETECCVCFKEFNSENPRLKPYHCDHSVDRDCFERMEAAAAGALRNRAAGTGASTCPQCRAAPSRTLDGSTMRVG